jgi:methyl-accepting chemotaxis protein
MMRFPRNLPINRKVMLVVLVTATACLILACLALFAFQLLSFRRNFVNDLSALSDVVANSSIASVAFDDKNAAVDILTGLKARPHVRSATIVKDGKIFAQFGQRDTLAALDRYPKETGYLFDDDNSLLHSKLIAFEDEPIGMLYVRSDYRSVYLSLLKLYSGILAGVLAVSVGVAWVISMRLQRFVSDPILKLADTARSIAESRDYSVRATESKQDEVGILTEAFNRMLSQIEARDSVLQSTQETLRTEVSERRRAEEVLRESEERFRAFMDNSPAIAFIKDRIGRYVYLY